MERFYFVRERQIFVDELPDVVAILLADPNAGFDEFGASAADSVLAATSSSFGQRMLADFTDSGWRFVLPTDDVRDRLGAREPVAGIADAGKALVFGRGPIAVAPYRLNVRLQPQFSREDCERILRENGLRSLVELKLAPNLFHVASEGREDALAVSVRLHESADFVYAEPSLLEHIPQGYQPTDPDYHRQWHLNNTGQTGGKVGADIRAESAWDETRGAGIRVAVIDWGFDVDHLDLAPGISPASAHFSKTGVFTSGTATMPDDPHGTNCAGMAGAREGNNHGGCGVAPECDLLLIGAPARPIQEQWLLAQAVGYAIDPATEGGNTADGADVVSCSIRPTDKVWLLSAVLQDALDSADSGRGGLGTPIFWAANNDAVSSDVDEVVSYPKVVAVVTSNHDDLKIGGLLGPGASGASIELTAPGTQVLMAESGGGYAVHTGTSFATPCAAACAALVLAVHDKLTREEVRQILRDSAKEIGGVTYDAQKHHNDYGHGRVNAHAAVTMAKELLPPPPPPDPETLKNSLLNKVGCGVVAVLLTLVILYLLLA